MEDTKTTLFQSQVDELSFIYSFRQAVKQFERLDIINERFVLKEVEL